MSKKLSVNNNFNSYISDEKKQLNELNLNNFNTNNVTDMYSMLYECSDDLKKKIKSENKNIKAEAFYL